MKRRDWRAFAQSRGLTWPMTCIARRCVRWSCLLADIAGNQKTLERLSEAIDKLVRLAANRSNEYGGFVGVVRVFESLAFGYEFEAG
jgi:hypothetical protein